MHKKPAPNWLFPIQHNYAGTLMRKAEMEGTAMADWFRRQSPSKWMRGIIDNIQQGVAAGWDRLRSVTSKTTKRLAATVIETALWSHAGRTLLQNWTAREFRHVTRQDEMVCDRCRPRHGQVFRGQSNGPPVHPRYQCIAVPVEAG